MQDRGERFRHLSVPVVEGGDAADPVEDVNLLFGRFLYVEPLGPFEPLALAHAVGVEPVLQVLVEELQLRGYLAQGHRQISAHLYGLIEGGDGDRAVDLAGEAGGARPERFFLDHLVEQALFVLDAAVPLPAIPPSGPGSASWATGVSGSGKRDTCPGTCRSACMRRGRRSASR